MVYLNNILIYINFSYKYKYYIKIILKYLKSENLFLNMTMFKFNIINILYLKFIISIHGIKIDLTKIKIVLK